MRRTWCVLAVVAAGCGTPRSEAPVAEPALRAPFDVEARREAHRRPGEREPMPRFGPPVIDLEIDSYYGDAAHSIVDADRKAEHDAAVAPLRQYYRDLARLANRYARAMPREPAVAAAALEGLAAWAEGGALLGKMSQQGEYQRGWALGAMALAYLQIRDAPGLDAAKRRRVEAWLAELARAVTRTRSNTDAKRDDYRNNHRYWSGLAVGAAAVAANDRALLAWAFEAYDLFVKEERGGVLPLEARRGTRALHYHLFALEALEPLAEIGAANGTDLRGRGGALARVVDHVLEGLRDHRAFGEGEQDVGDPPAPGEAAWLEIEYVRSRDPRIPPLLDRLGASVIDPLIGGDAMLLYGAR